MRYVGNVIRPPSEADSLILQATIGCAHNRCIFCGTYRDQPFRMRDLAELFQDIEMAKKYYGSVRRVFLADGDALILPAKRLAEILRFLHKTFPELQRVGIYARANDILKKTREELEELAALGLKILYVGLESGSDKVLELMKKNCTFEEAVQGCRLAQSCGMKLSTIILLGIGGRRYSEEHARGSARLINEISPRYLSVLSLIILRNTPLHEMVNKGDFELPDPVSSLREMALLLENLHVEQCIFRSNHASNYLPLAGTLNKDREKLLQNLRWAISQEVIKPEFLRGL